MARKQKDPQKRNAWRNQAAPGWVHVVSGISGCREEGVMLFGVNIFAVPWQSTGRKVIVNDPLRGEPHEFPVYIVEVNGKKHEIAYGEYCMNIGGLYARK